jgi:hypothetical protein
MLAIAVLIIAGLMVVNTLLIVASTGKPRKPVSAGMVAWVVALQALYVVVLVLAAIKLGV